MEDVKAPFMSIVIGLQSPLTKSLDPKYTVTKTVEPLDVDLTIVAADFLKNLDDELLVNDFVC